MSSRYDEREFRGYWAAAAAGLFRDETEVIDGPRSTHRLLGFFAKNHCSFFARATAGVCVAYDEEQWNMPNYLQFVLHDSQELDVLWEAADSAP